MPELMRHNARSEAERVTHLVQVVAELANERLFGKWAGQEPSIGRQRTGRRATGVTAFGGGVVAARTRARRLRAQARPPRAPIRRSWAGV